ncbi:MAG TPA: hypothetical protein VGJ20_37475 [Xanthobacteraceae bacterium]|jgi:hypothetical protein
MTIETPAYFGLIARKNERTCAYIEQRRARLLSVFREKNLGGTLEGVDRFSVQDESLFGLSVAMNGNNLAQAIEEIERAGCVRGVDFVVTSHFEGVLDKPFPNWLSVEKRPVTFIPEQLSTMDPKLREVVERQPPRMASFYTFVASGE